MRNILLLTVILSLIPFPGHAQQENWRLPTLTIIDQAPRSYRFTVRYYTSDTQGKIVHRDRITAEYTRDLSNGVVSWKNATLERAEGSDSAFSSPRKLPYLEGFHYPNNLQKTFASDFFQTFPSEAVLERNLIWDTGMLEMLAHDQFERLKLNEAIPIVSEADVKMPGVGVFHNHNLVLEWVGKSERNGQICAVILYRAYLNPLMIDTAGVQLKGRSNYWGEIWVSLKTKQIEYGTLYEEVTGELKMPRSSAALPTTIFREGVFEPISQ